MALESCWRVEVLPTLCSNLSCRSSFGPVRWIFVRMLIEGGLPSLSNNKHTSPKGVVGR